MRPFVSAEFGPMTKSALKKYCREIYIDDFTDRCLNFNLSGGTLYIRMKTLDDVLRYKPFLKEMLAMFRAGLIAGFVKKIHLYPAKNPPTTKEVSHVSVSNNS